MPKTGRATVNPWSQSQDSFSYKEAVLSGPTDSHKTAQRADTDQSALCSTGLYITFSLQVSAGHFGHFIV